MKDLDALYLKLLSLGYSRIEIHRLTIRNPYLFFTPIEIITNNFQTFLDFGFYSTEVIKMTNHTPILLTYNIQELINRLNFYNELGLLNYVKHNSHNLLYSLDLIVHRRKYVPNTCLEDLFLNLDEFKEKYYDFLDNMMEDE